MIVYVAGASRERGRARGALDLVKGCSDLELASDWLASIDHYGAANEGLTAEAARDVALRALEAVYRSSVLWLLLPKKETAGAWVELGGALMCEYAGVGPSRIVVTSGPRPDRTIFVELGNIHFPDDLDAFEHIAAFALSASVLPVV